MELTTYFYFFVLPLGGLICILTLVVLYVSRSEERHKKKMVKLARAYMKDRLKQRDVFTKQLEVLDTQLQNKAIDKNTYARLRNVLVANFEKRSEAARLQLTSSRPEARAQSP